jgi:hypothetical protein
MDGNCKRNKACPRCGSNMQQVAEVPPLNGSPGLLAWLCQECGAADSELISPPYARPTGGGYHAAQQG